MDAVAVAVTVPAAAAVTPLIPSNAQNRQLLPKTSIQSCIILKAKSPDFPDSGCQANNVRGAAVISSGQSLMEGSQDTVTFRDLYQTHPSSSGQAVAL